MVRPQGLLLTALVFCTAAACQKSPPHPCSQAFDGAIRSGDVDQIQTLLDDGCDVNAKGQVTALGMGIMHCRSNIVVRLLLEHGANPNSACFEGMLPLQLAASERCNDIIETLLEYGVNINASDSMGNTALHETIRLNRKETTQFLLRHGANVNAQGIQKCAYYKNCLPNQVGLKPAPIHLAIQENDQSLLELLLDSGANPDAFADFDPMRLQEFPVHRYLISPTALAPLHLATIQVNLEMAKLLIAKGANVNSKDGYGLTPLMHAIATQDDKLTKLLLENGADVNVWVDKVASAGVCRDLESDKHNWQLCENIKSEMRQVFLNATRSGGPVVLAAAQGNLLLVRQLIEKGATVKSALFGAVLSANIDLINLLIEHGADVNEQNSSGETPLLKAAKTRSPNLWQPIASLLISSGAQINHSDQNGSTFLMQAASRGDLPFMNSLLSLGADVNARTKRGYTPLHFTQDAKIASRLISAGAIVDARTADGWTSLRVAISGGRLDVAAELIRLGAAVNSRDELGQTPLFHVRTRKAALLLLANGADQNITAQNGATPLHTAIMKDLIQFFVERGLAVNAKRAGGVTPLHDAAIRGSWHDTVRYLIEAGANVNARTTDDNVQPMEYLGDSKLQFKAGETPLHWAFSREAAKILLDAGADVNAQRNDGLTPLQRAIERNDKPLQKLLIEHGAKVNPAIDYQTNGKQEGTAAGNK
jgi:ankyrin repeat protein